MTLGTQVGHLVQDDSASDVVGLPRREACSVAAARCSAGSHQWFTDGAPQVIVPLPGQAFDGVVFQEDRATQSDTIPLNSLAVCVRGRVMVGLSGLLSSGHC